METQALDHKDFANLNTAFAKTFQPAQLRLGLVMPIEAYAVGAAPNLERDFARAKLAEQLGFTALWLRDVPFNVPSFGDVGQIHDPCVYLGMLAAKTNHISLGVASIILPLRHPAHVAKAAASVDVLSGGRLLMGIASGDRPEEFPATGQDFAGRGQAFREAYDYIRAMAESFPHVNNEKGHLRGNADMLPKPVAGRLPLLITGGSQQDPQWVAEHGDGWMTYPRNPVEQGRVVRAYRYRVAAAGLPNKPVMQSLYIDLQADPKAEPRPIHLGFAAGSDFLIAYLKEIQAQGINHVALNLRFNQAPIEDTMQQLAAEVLPHFHE